MRDKKYLSTWLEAATKMVPGTRRAIILLPLSTGKNLTVSWPDNILASDSFVKFVQMASHQNAFFSADHSDKYTWIAVPINYAGNSILAVEVEKANIRTESIKPIVEWAATWMKQLLTLQDELDSDKQNETQLSQPAKQTEGIFQKTTRILKDKLKARVVLFSFSVLLLISLIPMQYNIAVQTHIEGKIEAPVVAPFDGFIQESKINAGDAISKGDILVSLDDEQIQLTRNKLKSQRFEKLNEYRQALSIGDRNQSEILKAQTAQVEGSIAEIEILIEQSELKSPISGWVIAGDVSRSIGAQVEKGEVLFRVAPLNSYRAMLQISESDVRFIKKSQVAILKLFALPGSAMEIEVSRLSPLYEDSDGHIYYLAEASIDNTVVDKLRPGMEGLAKVNVGQYPLIWHFFHHFVDWVRIQAWQFGL